MGRPVERSWAKGGRVYETVVSLSNPCAGHTQVVPQQLLERIERRVPDLAPRQHARMELLIYLYTQMHGCRVACKAYTSSYTVL